MNWYIIFYLFGIADKVGTVFGTLTVLTGIVLFIVLCLPLGSDMGFDNDEWKKWRKWFFTFFFAFFFSISLWTFIPNREQMTLIVAGGVVGEFVTNDENAKKLPADVMRFLRAEVNKATAELDLSDLGVAELDTLKDKSKEELIKMIKSSTK